MPLGAEGGTVGGREGGGASLLDIREKTCLKGFPALRGGAVGICQTLASISICFIVSGTG